MLSRLSSLWHSQQINLSSDKKKQFCSALGDVVVFVFASSPDIIKQQHDISNEQESFLQEFSQCDEAKKIVIEFSNHTSHRRTDTSSFSPLLNELTKQSSGVFGKMKFASNPQQRELLEKILSALTSAESAASFVRNSSPENLLEFFVYLLAVFNKHTANNISSNHPDAAKASTATISFDILVAAFCFANSSNNSSPSSNNYENTLKVALLRHAATLDQNGQNPVLNSLEGDSLAKCLPTVIRCIVDVLDLSTSDTTLMNSQRDIFLRQFCAPVLSQFGFEFLWKHAANMFSLQTNNDETNNHNSSNEQNGGDEYGDDVGNNFTENQIINLLHYCQNLTYKARLEILKMPKELSAHLLPIDNIVANPFYFGGFDSINVIVPTFWRNVHFKNIQQELFPSSTLSSHYRGRQQQQDVSGGVIAGGSRDGTHDSNNNNNNNNMNAVAASLLRRSRYAAKVAASSVAVSSSSSPSSSATSITDQNWIQFYNLFINNNNNNNNNNTSSSNKSAKNAGSVVIPNDIKNIMASALGLMTSNNNNNSSSLPFDPMMLATLFHTSNASMTGSGRLWLIEKLLHPSQEILINCNSNPSNHNNSANLVQSMQPFWILSLLMLLDNAASNFKENVNSNDDDDEDYGEGSYKINDTLNQQLFNAGMSFTLLERLESLAVYSSAPSCTSLELINVMKFDTLICGFGNENNNNSNSNIAQQQQQQGEKSESCGINRGAQIFRSAFCNFGIVRNKFQEIVRSTWQKFLRCEMEEQEKNANEQIQRIHFKLSELTSLITVILVRILETLMKHSSGVDNGNGRAEINTATTAAVNYVVTCSVMCEFLAAEWDFALIQFMEKTRLVETNKDVRKQLAGDLTSIKELCEGCLNKITVVTSDEHSSGKKNMLKRSEICLQNIVQMME